MCWVWIQTSLLVFCSDESFALTYGLRSNRQLWNSSQRPIYIINSVVKTKQSFNCQSEETSLVLPVSHEPNFWRGGGGGCMVFTGNGVGISRRWQSIKGGLYEIVFQWGGIIIKRLQSLEGLGGGGKSSKFYCETTKLLLPPLPSSTRSLSIHRKSAKHFFSWLFVRQDSGFTPKALSLEIHISVTNSSRYKI